MLKTQFGQKPKHDKLLHEYSLTEIYFKTWMCSKKFIVSKQLLVLEYM